MHAAPDHEVIGPEGCVVGIQDGMPSFGFYHAGLGFTMLAGDFLCQVSHHDDEL